MRGPLSEDQRAHIQARIDKAAEFRNAAEEAFEKGYYDTCVSRAYYAFYHAAVALLLAYGFPQAETSTSHEWIMTTCIYIGAKRNKWLVNVRMTGMKDFESSLRALHGHRVYADYNVKKSNRRTAKKVMDLTNELLVIINERVERR